MLGGSDVGSSQTTVSQTTTGLLGDIFGFTQGTTSYVAPKANWLPAEKGKGFDIWGTFSRKLVLFTLFAKNHDTKINFVKS